MWVGEKESKEGVKNTERLGGREVEGNQVQCRPSFELVDS